MKKSIVTQSLANFYPDWSRVRKDQQSIGFQFLNALSPPLEDMDKYLFKMDKNQYIQTANLDEVDWLYHVELARSFEFTYDTSDQLLPVEVAPTVRGLVVNNTYSGQLDVELADNNDLETLWYEAIPTRVDLEETILGDTDSLLSQVASAFPFSGVLEHHLGGGKLWLKASGGTQYISLDDEKRSVRRGEVILRGMTRKGLEESESLIFPWDMKQPTQKEWDYITKVEAFNIEDAVTISIYSADFANPPYWSFYNMRYSVEDTKVDDFWQIGVLGAASTIDRVGYVSNEWQTLMLGFADTEVKERWELLDATSASVIATDMAVQPFTNRAWVIAANKKLHCYDLDETMVEDVDFIALKSAGPEAVLDFDYESVLKGESIIFTPTHVRPLQEITKYRIWYVTPAGVYWGLLNGTQVAYTSNFWVYPEKLQRTIENEITVTASERGEYKFALELVYADETEQVDRRIVQVQSKTPLTTINLSSYLGAGTVEDIDFDSDQYMWIKTSLGYYRFSLHADLMLVDFTNKIIYLREDYETIEVTP